MLLLAIETTCDETAAAVIEDGSCVLSSVVASQDELHRRFGGVVPEIASRAHMERILPVIDQALREAGAKLADIGAVAVMHTPGLAGSILVGLSAAKALCLGLDVPLVGVNHVQAHIHACQLTRRESIYPCVGLVASGGHTSLFRCQSPLEGELMGGTIDDAAGEAFDKVASMLGLGFPGGPAVESAARDGNAKAFTFPRPLLDSPKRLEFSFSGLKTAVRYAIAGEAGGEFDASRLAPGRVADIAASFQKAAIDVLCGKAMQALDQARLTTLCVGGGVAANTALANEMRRLATERGHTAIFADKSLCTDNAAMGAIALERLRLGQRDPLTLDALPGLMRPARPR